MVINGENMCIYQLKYSFVEKGDPQCEQKKRYEEYVKKFVEKGCLIATNIKTYEILISEKADNLFKASPNFFYTTIYNSFSLSTILLAAFFSKGDDASIHSFLNYCEQNQKFIFTKDFYEEKINVPNSKNKVDMGKFETRLNESRQLLIDNAELISVIINNRNNVFAHFNKDYLINHKKQLTVTIENLKKALDLVERVLNKIWCYYDRTYRCFDPINIADIKQTISVIDKNIKTNNK